MRRIGALVALAVLLVGVPVGLAAWGDLTGLLSLDFAHLWEVRDDGSLLVSLFTVVGWGAWAIFALATVAEVAGHLAGRRFPLPGLGWAQGLAGALVVGALAQGLQVPAVAAPPEQPSQPVAAAVQVPQAPQVAEPQAASRVDGPTYVVAPGDDLWTLAERLLGDGLAWRDLFELNRDVISQPDHIEAGWVLRLPAPAVARAGVAPAAVGPQVPDEPAAPVASSAAPVGATPDAGAPTDHASAPAAGVAPAVPGSTPAVEPDPAATSAGQDQAFPAPGSAPTTTTRPASPAQAQQPQVLPATAAEDSTSTLAVGLGGLAAAAVLGAVALRRHQRAGERPVGSRFVDPSPAARRVEAMLAAQRRPLTPADLALVRRVVAQECREGELPHLAHALVAADRIEFVLTHDAPLPPVGFLAQGRSWIVPANGLEFLRAEGDLPMAWPALVAVGESPSGTVMVDLAEAGHLGVDDPATLDALLATLLASEGLACVVVGQHPLVAQFSSAGGRSVAEVAEALELLPSCPPSREDQLDRDLADAARPRVVVAPEGPAGLREAVSDGRCAIVAPGGRQWRLAADGLTSPWGDVPCTPSHLAPDAAADLGALVQSAATSEVEPADWWATDDAASVTWLRPRPQSPLLVARAREDHVTDPPHPMLGLLGPIELRGARGEEPPRAIKQCIEYAAFLLEHPGCTATQMANGLLVAEGTRRSNMSRLRTWLGAGDDGQPYLPDAYSGRIFLSADVGSDWSRLRLLVGPGVNRVSPDSLAAALDLVRGAPLADAAPGQWVWAEPMRSDMVALVRDVAATLAQHALDAGDLDLVRWATARGLVAAPADEILTVLRIRAEHRAGNMVEAERLVSRLAQHARNLGVDLSEDTIIALQEVMEGIQRARAVPR